MVWVTVLNYCKHFSTAYRKHACLKRCAQERVIESLGCAWTYLTTDYPQDVKTCGHLPDVYLPDECIWTNNVTILRNQMDTCLEPLQKALDNFIEAHILMFNFKEEGNYTNYWLTICTIGPAYNEFCFNEHPLTANTFLWVQLLV